MAHQLATLSFFWKIGAGAALAIAFCIAAHYFNKGRAATKVSATLFSVPTGNVLTILGILVPTLVALLAYLFSQDSEQEFSYLAAAIVLFLVTLAVAIYESFVIAGKGSPSGEITLSFPADTKLMAALGVMYALLLLGLAYMSLFLLVEMKPAAVERAGPDGGVVYIGRPAIGIGDSRDEVRNKWGAPDSMAKGGVVWNFRSPRSTIVVEFDQASTVRQIVESAAR